MSDEVTRYELPPAGITLLGYVVRRMHKTQWLTFVPELISADKTDEALAQVAMYAVTSSTSFRRAYYQPQFNSVGAEVSETDPQTGAIIKAKLEASSPAYQISYSAAMPNGDRFSGREEIAGTTLGLRGLGMPASSKFNFKSGSYTAALTGIVTSELVLSLVGRTRIRAYGFLNFNDNENNTGKLTIDRNQKINLELNDKEFAWLQSRGFAATLLTLPSGNISSVSLDQEWPIFLLQSCTKSCPARHISNIRV